MKVAKDLPEVSDLKQVSHHEHKKRQQALIKLITTNKPELNEQSLAGGIAWPAVIVFKKLKAFVVGTVVGFSVKEVDPELVGGEILAEGSQVDYFDQCPSVVCDGENAEGKCKEVYCRHEQKSVLRYFTL